MKPELPPDFYYAPYHRPECSEVWRKETDFLADLFNFQYGQ